MSNAEGILPQFSYLGNPLLELKYTSYSTARLQYRSYHSVSLSYLKIVSCSKSVTDCFCPLVSSLVSGTLNQIPARATYRGTIFLLSSSVLKREISGCLRYCHFCLLISGKSDPDLIGRLR